MATKRPSLADEQLDERCYYGRFGVVLQQLWRIRATNDTVRITVERHGSDSAHSSAVAEVWSGSERRWNELYRLPAPDLVANGKVSKGDCYGSTERLDARGEEVVRAMPDRTRDALREDARELLRLGRLILVRPGA